MRNLDWTSDTGLADHKVIAVYHPPGVIPHATIGFAGVYICMYVCMYVCVCVCMLLDSIF